MRRGHAAGSRAFLIAVVLSACAPTPVATTVTTTTAVTPTVTSTTFASTIPAVTLPAGAIGDPVAIEEARANILAFVALEPDDYAAGLSRETIPWPDQTNPDPVVALESIWEFDEWVATTSPDMWMAELYFVKDSPAWKTGGKFIERLDLNDWIVEFDDPAGYQFLDGGIIEIGSTSIPDQISTKAPVGSVAIKYRSNAAAFAVAHLDGSLVGISGSAWEELEEFAVIAPTPLGWQIYWYSLGEGR